LYLQFYEGICEDRGIRDSIGFGTQAHVREVWSSLPASDCFHKQGRKVKLCRWYSWFSTAAERRKDWHTLLLVLHYMGINKKWWSRLNELDFALGGLGVPAGHADLPSALGVEATPAAVIAEVPRAVADGNLEVERMRKDAKNTLHFTARTMSNRFVLRSVCVCLEAMEPVHTQFNLDLTRTKTQQGVQSWHFDLACGHGHSVLTSIAAKLKSPAVMHACLFESQEVGEELAADEDLVASKLLKLCALQLSSRLVHTMMYSHSLPGKFVALASNDATVRAECLQWLSSLWSAYTAVEEEAKSNMAARSYLQALLWPELTYCLELLVSLSEVDFKHVPPDVHQQVLELSRAPPGTKLVEDGFNIMRDGEGSNKKGQLGRKARFQAVYHAGLVEAFDRQPPRVTAAAKASAASTLDADVFSCSLNSFSFGRDTLMEWGRNGVTFSPAAFSLVPLATICLMQCHGEWGLLANSWLSLLVGTHCILHNVARKRSFFTLQVSPHGVLAWAVTICKYGGQHFYQLKTQGTPVWELLVVTDPSDWRACRVKAMPPCRLATLAKGAPGSERPVGLPLAILGSLQPLVKFSARAAFPNLQVAHLQKLCKAHGLKQSSRLPQTEKACLGLLLEALLPSASAEERQAIMARRCGAASGDQEDEDLLMSFLDEDKLDEVGTLLEPDQVETAKKLLKAKGLLKPSKPGASSASGSASASAAGSSSVGAKVRQPINPDACATPSGARKYAPPVSGCTITKDTRWHNRWAITYPTKVPPRSHSRSWGDESAKGSHQCMLECLAWAWAHHTADTGEPCPWQLDV